MADDSFTKPERDALLAELQDIFARRYPEDPAQDPSPREDELLRERYYLRLGEYADRLPRITLSVCPYCDSPLKRAFDPFGVDGPWWVVRCQVAFEEPRACEHFKVLQGALGLNSLVPLEAREQVQPGPAVPFLIPALLRLPGMKAVVSRTTLATGHIAYPIAYFSDHEIDPARLCQTWCRDAHWFKDAEGNAGWLIATYPYDFELEPYFKQGKLLWSDLAEKEPRVLGPGDGPCPLLALPGDRERQDLSDGERELMGLPSGEPVIPFGD